MRRDRRRTPRIDHDVQVKMRTTGRQNRKKTGYRSARSKNLSAFGVYLATKTPPGPESYIEIGMGSGLVMVGQVVRIEPLSDSWVGVAVRFVDPGSLPDLKPRNPEDRPSNRLFAYEFEIQQVHEEAFSYYKRLGDVRRYVKEHFSRQITLAMGASLARMERTYFSRFFRQKVGITFREWLQYYRVSRAMALLGKGDFSIKEVASFTGFGSARTLERAFRKWTSMAPREFKKLSRPS